jgi:hypothetical protein
MTAKEYLSQVGKIQTRIKCLSEQVQFMREAAENVTSVISDMPRSPNRNTSRLENSVVRIVDLEEKLQAELDKSNIQTRPSRSDPRGLLFCPGGMKDATQTQTTLPTPRLSEVIERSFL